MTCTYQGDWQKLSSYAESNIDVRDCVDAMILPELFCAPCRAAQEIRCRSCGNRHYVKEVLIDPETGADFCPNCVYAPNLLCGCAERECKGHAAPGHLPQLLDGSPDNQQRRQKT